MSFATKYRPRVLEDVVGQEVPVKIISNVLKRFAANNCNVEFLPNCIILEGEYGSGKTTLARILARYLNCETAGPVHACGECKSCQDIEHDRSRNLVEVDAASNRGISEINTLKERTGYKVPGRVMTIVLDEVHQLSKDAWSALLKTLEESQRNVMWVLCTTDSQKILDTIRSRSTVLHVNTVTPTIAAERIKSVAITEQIEIDDQTAGTIAFISKGHMRDCLQLLETASGLSDSPVVTLNEVYSAANLTSSELVISFVNSFYSADEAGINNFIQTYVDSPATIIKSATFSVHSSIVQVAANDPVPLADKLLLTQLLIEARREFNAHGFAFPFIKHFWLRFQKERVKVAA
jgi:DNA polymerase-3 subunit gamma/tau